MTECEDRVYDLADTVQAAMERHPHTPDWTPSGIARKARISGNDARTALRYLAANRYIVADGNGAWTRYSLTDHARDCATRALRHAQEGRS